MRLPAELLAALFVLAVAALHGPRASASDELFALASPAKASDMDAGAAEEASIISIESAPDTVEPLRRAIEDQGDPRRDLWARIRAGFALPPLDTPLVAENEAWYAERPEFVSRVLERGKRYLFYIVEEVERRGMPTEIALLPIVESAFNPQAYSRAKAAGIWQFMPATGRTFGLRQNWWVDERRHVLSATNAALDYLQKLYNMFGDWHLALAAYNWGEGNLTRAIARNQAQGLPTDYVNLRLPVETANYVPRLLAVKRLIERPEAFSIKLGPLPNRPYFAQITITRHIDVAMAAKLAEIPLSEFLSLNPHYNRPVIHAEQPTTLLLPVDKAEVFARNIEGHRNKPLVSWRPYHARMGERLDVIARRHGLTVARLKAVNGIAPGVRRLARGQLLLVPGTPSGPAFQAADSGRVAKSADTRRPAIYTVRRGDTLTEIARRHGLGVAELKAWNRLPSLRLMPGQKLRLDPPAETVRLAQAGQDRSPRAAKRGPRKTEYRVRRGDTLYGIAQRFDVDVNELRRWNRLSPTSRIRPGDTVTIYLARAD